MQEKFLLKAGQGQVNCLLSLPEGGEIRRVVLGVHGMGGSTQDAIQRSLAEEMTLFDSAVLQFDFPGHGENPTQELTLRGCVDALVATAGEAKARFPEIPELCIFASGFGAYVTLTAMEALLALPGTLRVVVQTPAARMDQTILAMCGGLSRETLWAMDSYTIPIARPLTITCRFYDELADNFVIQPYPVPMLILQGEEDSYIRMSDVRALREANEDSRLVIIPGASHRFLEPGAWDMVLDLTRDWFEFQQVLLCDCE